MTTGACPAIDRVFPTAGACEQSGEPGPRLTSAPPATSRPGAASPGVSRLRALAARAAEVRAADENDDRPDDWADPDPAALTRLPEHHHPVVRAVNRSREGETRTKFRSTLKVACAILTGRHSSTLTFEDALAYPWHLLDQDIAEAFHRDVYHRYTNQATRNDKIVAVRRVVDECHKARTISPLRRQVLLDALYTESPGRSRRRRRIDAAGLEALLAAAASHPTAARAARDTAMVALIRATGLRSCEIAGLSLEDWDQADGSVLVRDRKNGDDLVVFVTEAAGTYLRHWLQLRGTWSGPLFSRCCYRSREKHLSPEGVRFVLKSVAKKAGMEWLGSHTYRRTFATEMLEQHDAVLVSDLLGQRKVDSVRVYDMRGDEARRRAVAAVPLPPLDSLLSPCPNRSETTDEGQASSGPPTSGTSCQHERPVVA